MTRWRFGGCTGEWDFSTWAGSGYYGSQLSLELKAAYENTYDKYIFAALLLLEPW